MAKQLVESTLYCMGLSDILPRLESMPKAHVLGTFPKMCYSFARMQAEVTTVGFYCEGYTVLPELPMFPVYHAWYVDPSGKVIDGTTVPATAQRVGLKIPADLFNKYMNIKKFRERYELYGEFPFARVCMEQGRPF